jgi:uncharacterized protein YuzE
MVAITVQIGDLSFGNNSYDEQGDVVYLHVGEPRAAVDFDETPEGHARRSDAAGKVIGLTIVNARWLLERDGEIVCDPARAGARGVGDARAADRHRVAAHRSVGRGRTARDAGIACRGPAAKLTASPKVVRCICLCANRTFGKLFGTVGLCPHQTN